MSRKRPLPPAPATGSRWKRKTGPLEDKPARVIGVVEDYVVIRYPRAVPRCFHVRDFYAEWTPEAPTRVPDDPEAEQDCQEHAAKREKKK